MHLTGTERLWFLGYGVKPCVGGRQCAVCVSYTTRHETNICQQYKTIIIKILCRDTGWYHNNNLVHLAVFDAVRFIGQYIFCDILQNLWNFCHWLCQRPWPEAAWRLQRIFWPALLMWGFVIHHSWMDEGLIRTSSLCHNAKLFSHDLLFGHSLIVPVC